MTELEALLARDAIRDVIARYTIAFDDHDWESWERLWTDDVVFVVDGTPIEGVEALRAFMTTCLPDSDRSKHICGNPLIELGEDGFSATAKTDVVWIAQNFENTIVARYVDTFVKRSGRWLIARREEWPVPYRPGPPPMSPAATQLSGATMRR